MKRIGPMMVFILPMTAIVLVIYQIIISNELATLGKDLGRLNTELAVLSDTHELLVTEVASSSSYLVMRSRAEALGFTTPSKDQIIALTQQSPVALFK